MSCSWRYVCVSHEPNLVSDEAGNRDSGLKRMRELYIARPALLAAMEVLASQGFDIWNLADDHREREALRWFRAHPSCALRARSEYGDDADLTSDEASA